jgi:CHAT domain-containing protein/tetratricopeptide (TPR) repeat protein
MELPFAVDQITGGSPPECARDLNNLALMLQYEGDLRGAQHAMVRALELTREVFGEHHPDFAMSLNNQTLLFLERGDLAAARLRLEKALVLIKETQGEKHEAYAIGLNTQALLLKAQGDRASALRRQKEALALIKDVLGKDHPYYADGLNNMGVLLQDMGDLEGARTRLEEALALSAKDHPSYAVSLNNLASLLLAVGDLTKAQALLEQALSFTKKVQGERHPDYALISKNLGSVLQSRGYLADARLHYEHALALRREVLGERHPNYALSLTDLSMLEAVQGHLIDARQLADRALDLYQVFVAQTLPALPEREQIALLDQYLKPLWISLSLSPGEGKQDPAAYRRLLAWKGISTQAASAQAATVRPEARRLLDQIAPLRSRLNQLYYARVPIGRGDEHARTIRNLTEQLTALQTALARAVAWDPKAPDPEQVAGALPERAAFVDVLRYTHYSPPEPGKYLLQGEPRYVAFVVRRGAPARRIELGPSAAIDKALAAWRGAIKKGHAGTETGQELAKLVWEPLRPHLEGVDTVLVAPDGDLAFLAWGALPDRDPNSFLIERYAFAVVGSGRQLVQLARRGDDIVPAGLLAVGGVDYGHGAGGPPAPVVASRSAPLIRGELNFGALPGTAAEADEIAQLFRQHHQGQAEILGGANATKDHLRTALLGKRYLHLATHGYFAPPEQKSMLVPDDDPSGLRSFEGMGRREVSGWYPGLLSGLVCSGVNQPPPNRAAGIEDLGAGVMTAEEVTGLDLKGTELVVLSACETGLGRVAGGEGVLGLQRAFQIAGARTVVASLWQMDDTATRKLMGLFYTNLWAKHLPAAEALRKAQWTMLNEAVGNGVNPYYWAGWMLSGDPGAR